MVNHVSEWLGAYLDGELRGPRLRQVEDHLAECAACRSELESLGDLSALLRETPPAGDFTPAARFVSNLTLRLPNRPRPEASRRVLQAGWWLVPLGILVAWVFLQTLSLVTSLFATADQAGLLGSAAVWLETGHLHTTWFVTVLDLFGRQLGENGLAVLADLDQTDLLVQGIASQFIWQLAVVGLYWGWLALWWNRHQRQAAGQETPRLPRATSQ
jgi:hypothetical protein